MVIKIKSSEKYYLSRLNEVKKIYVLKLLDNINNK